MKEIAGIILVPLAVLIGIVIGARMAALRFARQVEKKTREARARARYDSGAYTIHQDANGLRSITCHTCGMTSWSRGDVEHLWCEKCQKFHHPGDSRNLPFIA